MEAGPPPLPEARPSRPLTGWRLRWYRVIFEADTSAGRAFNVVLIAMILGSIAVVMADSVQPLRKAYGPYFNGLEWFFTIAFTVEYIARLVCVRRPLEYVTSFFGIIDLIALLPTYLALLFPELGVLIDVRVLRLLRVFRIFKLAAYVTEYQYLGRALRASGRKILVFLSAVMMLVVVMGTIMYVVEGATNGFTSIPTSIYWAISTVTTVGFGDITPKTDLGRAVASVMMLMGWGVLAVPTGIVTAEMAMQRRGEGFKPRGNVAPLSEPPRISSGQPADASAAPATFSNRVCHDCMTEGHAPDANFCYECGAVLPRD
jgi:voltage-gated potassium channel